MMPKVELPRRIFLAAGVTDMRKSINGLSLLVESGMGGELFSGDMFVFCNRRRDMIKILYWDRNGFALWHKRLEQDRFAWPKEEQGAAVIGQDELAWLLAGLDFTRAHQKLTYSKMN